MNSMCIAWRKSVRRIWKVPYKTHCNLIPFISNSIPIEVIIHRRFYRFFDNCINSDNGVISYIFNNALMSNSRLGKNFKYVNHVYGRNLENALSWLDKYSLENVNTGSIIRDLINVRDGLNGPLSYCESQLIIELLCTSWFYLFFLVYFY